MMQRLRHLNRSGLSVMLAAAVATVTVAIAQEQSVQKLLERGALQEAASAGAEAGDPEAVFLAAFAALKMNDNDAARQRYDQLRGQGDESWKAIGEAASKLLDNDVGGAVESASRAIAANDGNPYAHFQLGIATSRDDNWARAFEAFTRATELKPDFAYAHYYAGQAAQRVEQTSKAVDHYTAFVRLAPDAPERSAVQSLLRSIG
jgi:tetratricopeptide (TPR) repeat protein